MTRNLLELGCLKFKCHELSVKPLEIQVFPLPRVIN